MKCIYSIILILAFINSSAQVSTSRKAYSGTVIDTRSKLPIAGVAVTFSDTTVYTDNNGYFRYIDFNPTVTKIAASLIVQVEIYTLQGQRIGDFANIQRANLFIKNLPYSYYVLVFHDEMGEVKTIQCTPNSINKLIEKSFVSQQNQSALKSQIVDDLIFSKTGYYTQQWPLRPDSAYEIVSMHYCNWR